MCYHNDIRLNSNNILSPADVRVDNPLAKSRVLDVWFIYRAEDSWFESIGLGVVELFQVNDCFLFLVLKIYERLAFKPEAG